MNRREWIVTAIGLIATYCLPWPCPEPEGKPPVNAMRIAERTGKTAGVKAQRDYVILERTRAGLSGS